MKKVVIYGGIIFLVSNWILSKVDFWEMFYFNEMFGSHKINTMDLIVIIFVQLILLFLSLSIPWLVLDNISESTRDFTGKITGRNAETNTTTTFIPINSSGTTMLMPMSSSSRSYSLFIQTSDGKVYECKCSREEFVTAKDGNVMSFIEDIRKSGAIYYYTK